MSRPKPEEEPTVSRARRAQVGKRAVAPAPKEHIRALIAAASDKLALDPVEASVLADQALQMARALGDLPLHGEAALTRAATCHQRADLTSADEYIQESLQVFERAGKGGRVGRVYKLQSLVFSMQDRVSLALRQSQVAVLSRSGAEGSGVCVLRHRVVLQPTFRCADRR